MKADMLEIAAESMRNAENPAIAKMLALAECRLQKWYNPQDIRKWEKRMPLYADTDFTDERLRDPKLMIVFHQLFTAEEMDEYRRALGES